MGNASGKGEGEGSSGQPTDELEEVTMMEIEPQETPPPRYRAPSVFSLHKPRTGQSTAMFIPQTEYSTEAFKHLAEFEPPPSPPSSYDNEPFYDADFKKQPPVLPPHLRKTLLDVTPEAVLANSGESLPRPNPSTLNHLYTRKNQGGEPVALGSTFRFRKKYVNVVLYTASRKSE